MKSDSILIVGGGSAGWMTAATLIKLFPNKKITLVESKDIKTVSVGESTLGQIKAWTHLLEIDEKDFMSFTDASYKLSIKFTDFYKKGSGGFHYPFGKPHVSKHSQMGVNDWFLKKAYYPDTPVQDFARTFYPAMALIESNKISKNTDGKFGKFSFDRDVAYHFDAIKFALWLKDKYSIPKGVNHIAATVKNIEVNDDGISAIVLDGGERLTADLYIDCTGWKSLLLGQSLGEPFISYDDILPNNRAWATQVPYLDKSIEIEPYTNCTAIDNGWVWNIPLWSRIGTGYVYSDRFISKEDALEQFKDHLRNRMTIKDEKRISDDLIFKDIEMRVGIHRRTWVKNVVAIGLSAGFIEPLESNGLLTIHEFLLKLVTFLGREVINQWDRDIYNRGTFRFFDDFAQFVSLHYALSVREDTEYWREIRSRSFSLDMVNCIPTTAKGFSDFADKKLFDNEYFHSEGIQHIATGMNYPIMDYSVIKVREFYRDFNYKLFVDQISREWDRQKKIYENESKSSQTIYNYLKENIYS